MPAELMDKPEVVNITTYTPPDPMAMLAKMVENGVDPDRLGKMLDFVERLHARQAQERFATALAAFQAECPAVFKHRQAGKEGTKFGTYQFASYDDVMEAAGPVLARHQIAVSFDTAHTEGEQGMPTLRVVVRLRVGSHFEDRTFTTPVPTEMGVTNTQKFGAALKYAMRYALCAALNIVTTDQDTDAANVYATLSGDQIEQLNDLIEKKQANLKRFLAWAAEKTKKKIEDLGDLPQSVFAEAMSMLKQKETPK